MDTQQILEIAKKNIVAIAAAAVLLVGTVAMSGIAKVRTGSLNPVNAFSASARKAKLNKDIEARNAGKWFWQKEALVK